MQMDLAMLSSHKSVIHLCLVQLDSGFLDDTKTMCKLEYLLIT